MDPSDSFIRIRCVLTILVSSGHYFTKGNARNKLKRLFVFFQRYLHFKESLPVDLTAECHSLMKKLAPDTPLYGTLEEAEEAVLALVGTAGLHDLDDGLEDDQEGPEETEDTEAVTAVQEDIAAAEPEALQPEVEPAESDVLFEKELASLVTGQVCPC